MYERYNASVNGISLAGAPNNSHRLYWWLAVQSKTRDASHLKTLVSCGTLCQGSTVEMTKQYLQCTTNFSLLPEATYLVTTQVTATLITLVLLRVEGFQANLAIFLAHFCSVFVPASSSTQNCRRCGSSDKRGTNTKNNSAVNFSKVIVINIYLNHVIIYFVRYVYVIKICYIHPSIHFLPLIRGRVAGAAA